MHLFEQVILLIQWLLPAFPPFNTMDIDDAEEWATDPDSEYDDDQAEVRKSTRVSKPPSCSAEQWRKAKQDAKKKSKKKRVEEAKTLDKVAEGEAAEKGLLNPRTLEALK